jgi:hypothetical protein
MLLTTYIPQFGTNLLWYVRYRRCVYRDQPKPNQHFEWESHTSQSLKYEFWILHVFEDELSKIV